HRKPLRLQLSSYAENPSAALNNVAYPCSLWFVVLHERACSFHGIAITLNCVKRFLASFLLSSAFVL
ncbi:MAG: hypothetical protein NTV57_03650, partial [Cyanobacteria bacterium]|nr:hypothetical protein [Cyanobacteriota bacterium]